jgi:serine/threonine-protein kinase
MFIQLTGHQVREADTPNEELLLAMTTPAPPLTTYAPNLPKPIVALVDRALAFEQDDRWPDARAMQAAVRDVQTELGIEGNVSIAHEVSVTRPIDSAAPVTLTAPDGILPTAFRSRLTPRRRRKLFVMCLGAAAALGPILIINWLPRDRADAAAQTIVTAATTAPPAVPSGDTIEAPNLVTASPEPVAEPAIPPGAPPAISGRAPLPARPKVRPGKPVPRAQDPKTPPAPPGSPPPVAPATVSQVPSGLDPLDRRR